MAPNFSSNIHAHMNYIYNIWDGKFSNKIYIQRNKNKACNILQLLNHKLMNYKTQKDSPTTRPRLWYHLKEYFVKTCSFKQHQ